MGPGEGLQLPRVPGMCLGGGLSPFDGGTRHKSTKHFSDPHSCSNLNHLVMNRCEHLGTDLVSDFELQWAFP